MSKYQPYSRREFRRRFTRWATRNLKFVLVLTVGFAGLLAFVTVLLTLAGPRAAWTWWLLGVLQAVTAAAYLHLLHLAFLAHDGPAIRHLRGAWGEENTRSELQRARRRRLVWGWVDSITFQSGDLDHLVVTRRGGLVAVDSKWRSEANDTIDMARAANKARLRAEGLARTVLTGERGARARHRPKVNPLRVTPVVVLWGAAQQGVPDGARVDDVEFVAGRRFVEWLRGLNGQPVGKAEAADVVHRLERFRASSWEDTQNADR